MKPSRPTHVWGSVKLNGKIFLIRGYYLYKKRQIKQGRKNGPPPPGSQAVHVEDGTANAWRHAKNARDNGIAMNWQLQHEGLRRW